MPSRLGSSNKNKKFLLNRLQKMYGDKFHPIMSIAANCKELQDAANAIEIPKIDEDPEDLDDAMSQVKAYVAAINAKHKALRVANAEWSRIAEYTEPKLKSVDIDLNADVDGLTFEMHYHGKPKTKTKKAKS